jgi:Fe2+ or Zn2+ uptake regulation protein
VNHGHQHARFDANMDRHHHLVCVSCHEINDVYDESLDRLSMSGGKEQQYRILGHRVEFYGVCKRCVKRNDPSYGRKGKLSEVKA